MVNSKPRRTDTTLLQQSVENSVEIGIDRNPHESDSGGSLGVKPFDDYQTEVFRLYLEKKYSDSLKVAIEAAKHFHDRTARTTFWIACLNSRLGNLDQALDALDEGLKKGAWWHEDSLSDPDLDPIREKPEFDRIRRNVNISKIGPQSLLTLISRSLIPTSPIQNPGLF